MQDPVIGCPDENELARLLMASSPEIRLPFEQHLESCQSCRWAALAMAETMPIQAAPDASASPPEAAPGDHEGRFSLRRVLGQGGFGIVWEAQDEATGELVALKIIQESGAAARRALREARGLARMDHPHIVKAREAFLTVDGRTALVTELLEGRDLAARLAVLGPLDEPALRRFLAQTCDALAYAHSHGVVHRDLTPRNVFLEGPSERVKLLDFGMARWLDALGVTSKLTRSGMVVGTPNYMSPEQISGESDVGPPSDIWSLGIVAVEAMSGRRAVEGKSFGKLFRAVTAGSFPRLAEVAPHASRGLVTIVDSMLALDPSLRPTAAGIQNALQGLFRPSALFSTFRCDCPDQGASSREQTTLARALIMQNKLVSSLRFVLPMTLMFATLASPAFAQATKKTPLAATSPALASTDPPGDAPAATESGSTPEEKKSSGWLFDGSLGLPKLKSNESSLAFDANVGWVGRSWGFGAYASSYTYALQQNDSLNQTQKMRFGLEARYLSGAQDADVRYEVKIEANSGAFNTTYISTNGVGGFSTEQSTLNRFTLMAGRHAKASERLRYHLGAGLGLQTDTYFRASDGNGEGDTNFSAASSVRYVGRARVIHRTLPETLSIRGELEASSFQLRRVAFFAGGSQTDADALSVTEFRENDVSLRLFGDIEKLAFVGLMPGVFVGLDYFGVSGGGRDTSALVPIFGVGLINTTPKD